MCLDLFFVVEVVDVLNECLHYLVYSVSFVFVI